jgi:hypothetical protein
MNKKILFRAISFIFIAINSIYIIYRNENLHIDKANLIIVILSILLYPRSVINKQTFYLLAYFIVMFIYNYIGPYDNSLRSIMLEVYPSAACLVIINIFMYNKDLDWLRIIGMEVLFCIIISSVFTSYGLSNTPNLAREGIQIAAAKGTNDLVDNFIAGFGLIHSIPLLIPVLVYKFKSEKQYYAKIIYLTSILVLLYLLVKASYATPIIVTMFSLLLSIMIIKTLNQIILFSIFLLVFIILLTNIDMIISFMVYIQPIFYGTVVDKKISDIIQTLSTGYISGDVNNRSVLYDISLNAFFSSIIIGGNGRELGGHSYFIDRLALYGVLGLMPYILFYYTVFKRNIIFSARDSRKYLIISYLSLLIILFAKNMVGLESSIYSLIFLPSLCAPYSYKGSSKIEAKIRQGRTLRNQVKPIRYYGSACR